MTKLIVGLGNPGRRYTNTRHNVGFRCINRLAKVFRIDVEQKKCRAEIGRGTIEGQEVVLAKPLTFMNLSGESVGPLLKHFYLPPSDLLVIHDDLDLPPGKTRIRLSGSAGGHHGMESIIGVLGTRDIARIRVGVGRPEEPAPGEDEADFLLSDFTSSERKMLEDAIERVVEAVAVILKDGLVAAMNRFNQGSGRDPNERRGGDNGP